MIRVVRDVYDYIIIDTPPLGRVIDCAVVADSCDGTVIVIESGSISYHFVQEIKGQLEDQLSDYRCNFEQGRYQGIW